MPWSFLLMLWIIGPKELLKLYFLNMKGNLIFNYFEMVIYFIFILIIQSNILDTLVLLVAYLNLMIKNPSITQTIMIRPKAVHAWINYLLKLRDQDEKWILFVSYNLFCWYTIKELLRNNFLKNTAFESHLWHCLCYLCDIIFIVPMQ